MVFEAADGSPNWRQSSTMARRAFVRVLLRGAARRARAEVDWIASRRKAADVGVFHEFHQPPYGGGNQFLLALVGDLRRRGLAVEIDRISGRTPVCLYNSFNFDFRRLRRFARADVRMVHRVDGPVGVYRGFDDGTDRRIAEINALADATILQSRYSLEKHRELGLELRNPVVIPNAVDPAIFHPPSQREPLAARRLRVIATSWSANPRKGADVLAWLDEQLDHEKYEVTFAGNTEQALRHIRVVAPVPSEQLADLLRAHDVFLAPSQDDPCSNALLEALACGLPAAFRRSGGHPELVGDAGIGFDDAEEVPEALARLALELEERRAAIRIASLREVADRYVELLEL
jgi:glycosyltransferase involved in cell wall biosynthesis